VSYLLEFFIKYYARDPCVRFNSGKIAILRKKKQIRDDTRIGNPHAVYIRRVKMATAGSLLLCSKIVIIHDVPTRLYSGGFARPPTAVPAAAPYNSGFFIKQKGN